MAIAALSWLQPVTPPSRIAGPTTPLPVPGAGPSTDALPAAGRLTIDQRIDFWAARVSEQPSDFLSLVQLGLAHAESARLAGDLDGYGRASAAIDRALALSPEYPPAIRARATVRYALHDFAGAAADAGRVLAGLPDDPVALATLADSQLELGRIDQAREGYRALESIAPGPALDVRLARLAYLTGDRQGAVGLARAALAAAPSVIGDSVERGFYEYALGEYARLAGDRATARAGFERALALRPTDLGALVGLARIEASEGRVRVALGLLDGAAAIAPQPEVMTLAGDLLHLEGDEAGATERYETVRLTGVLAGLPSAVYDRQLLLFELDRDGATEELVAAARSALADRSDAAGHDLVAWAAYRLGRLDLAAAESDTALATGIRDARLIYHAGAIAIATGDRVRGEALIREALALGPALDPLETAQARRLLGGG
ncbi:MAG TPA: tetratricopeptide repeat protein [Candidatus Limnocylindrales bacterium]|nr:tetratricopeptide repeat protein [Candidatus Limnocylindrales bacterium]